MCHDFDEFLFLMGLGVRIDKFLAGVTELSRSEAKRAIKAGEVMVAGVVERDPGAEVAADAPVTLAGVPLRAVGHRYFMLHKPAGYVCAAKDRLHPTVLELIDEDNREQLHAVGRLDIDTTGLVLLTDDGQWSHRVTSPRRDCRKLYRVECAEPIAEGAAEQFARGLFLHGEKQRLRPARLELLGPCAALVEIGEGKYHQVKRMFAASGNAVVALHRERIGAIVLDEALSEGAYRPLTEAEIGSV